jgi:hypothetical protein
MMIANAISTSARSMAAACDLSEPIPIENLEFAALPALVGATGHLWERNDAEPSTRFYGAVIHDSTLG